MIKFVRHDNNKIFVETNSGVHVELYFHDVLHSELLDLTLNLERPEITEGMVVRLENTDRYNRIRLNLSSDQL